MPQPDHLRLPEVEEVRFCACGSPRRPGGFDCRNCHNEREREARKRRVERQRARQVELEKMVELLTIAENSNTKENFDSRCRSRFVIVTADPGEEAQGFAGIVAGFHPGEMVTVLDARGYSHTVPLRRIKPSAFASVDLPAGLDSDHRATVYVLDVSCKYLGGISGSADLASVSVTQNHPPSVVRDGGPLGN